MTPNTPSPQKKPTVKQCIELVHALEFGATAIYDRWNTSYKGSRDGHDKAAKLLRDFAATLRASQAPAGKCDHMGVTCNTTFGSPTAECTRCGETFELPALPHTAMSDHLRERDCAAPTPAKCETCDELRKQIAALSKIDEKGIGHDDAVSSIASHVHEIQVLCDAFGYDPSQWLQDEVANDCAAPQAVRRCAWATEGGPCTLPLHHEGRHSRKKVAPQAEPVMPSGARMSVLAGIEPAAREVVHEQRIVGHASGRQERMPTCVCGKPWPCAGNDISRYAWGNPPFPKYPHETVDSMAEIGEAFMDAMPEGYNWLSSPAEVIADLSNKEYDATRLLAAEREKYAELMSALEALTDPENKFDSAINPGPERDELQAIYNKLRART
jgi:hypothetical protein